MSEKRAGGFTLKELAERLGVSPLKEGQTVTYQWHNLRIPESVGQFERKAQARDRVKAPSIAAVPAWDSIVIDGESIPIRYSTATRQVTMADGGVKEEPVLGLLRFERGMLVVSHHEPDKYYYLEICNYNLSRAGRNTNKKGLFRRYGDPAIRKREMDASKARSKAEAMVWNMPMNEVMVVCDALGIITHDPGGRGSIRENDDLCYEIIRKLGPSTIPAQGILGYSEFLFQVNNKVIALRADIKRMELKNKIRYVSARRTWVWIADEMEAGSICIVPPDVTDPVSALVMHLQTRPGDLEKIRSLLSTTTKFIGEAKLDKPFIMQTAKDKGVFVLAKNRWLRDGNEDIVYAVVPAKGNADTALRAEIDKRNDWLMLSEVLAQ